MKLKKKNRKDNSDIDSQVIDQITQFVTPEAVIDESINELESNEAVNKHLKSIDIAVSNLKQIIFNEYKDNKNINQTTLKKMLNIRIHMNLYGYDPYSENVTFNGDSNEK